MRLGIGVTWRIRILLVTVSMDEGTLRADSRILRRDFVEKSAHIRSKQETRDGNVIFCRRPCLQGIVADWVRTANKF